MFLDGISAFCPLEVWRRPLEVSRIGLVFDKNTLLGILLLNNAELLVWYLYAVQQALNMCQSVLFIIIFLLPLWEFRCRNILGVYEEKWL